MPNRPNSSGKYKWSDSSSQQQVNIFENKNDVKNTRIKENIERFKNASINNANQYNVEGNNQIVNSQKERNSDIEQDLDTNYKSNISS